MYFALLGGLEVRCDDGWRVPPAPPKPRQVLATLLLNAGRVTYTETLAAELWGDEPPESLSTTLQTYVYQLRRMLKRTCCAGVRIETRPGGYLLLVPPGMIDVGVFEGLVKQARACLAEHPERAAALLEDALALWRGPALADVDHGATLAGHVARIEELNLCAVELSVEAGLRVGRHRELVVDLKRLIRIHPFHETYHAQLIRALALSGRRREAVEAYGAVRALLRHELGVDPSPCLESALRAALEVPRAGDTDRPAGAVA